MTGKEEGLLLHPSFTVEVCRDSHGRYWMEPEEVEKILKLESDSCESVELIRKEDVVSQLQSLDSKTIKELGEVHSEWVKTFIDGSIGHHESYNKARDTRHLIEDERWVKLSDVTELLAGSSVKSENGKREEAK